MAKAKRIGRPPKAPRAGTRVSLGLKVTPEIKTRLDTAAKRSGRTQSQEAEFRLTESFRRADMFEAAFGGADIYRAAILMAAAFNTAGTTSAGGKKPAEWINDPDAYISAMTGVFDALLIGFPGTEEQAALMIESLKSRLLTRIANKESNDVR